MKINNDWNTIYADSCKVWADVCKTIECTVAVEKLLETRTSEGLDVKSAALILNAILCSPEKQKVMRSVIAASSALREKLYKNNVYLMAPIEVSDFCSSECSFCGWRSSNREIRRTRISDEAFLAQANYLMDLGIGHIEIVGGDDSFFVDKQLPVLISTLKKVAIQRGCDIDVSICTMPFSEEKYKILADFGLDAVITWQETYDLDEYKELITKGPKSCSQNYSGYEYRLESQLRAASAGLQIGVGAMLGLSENMAADIIATIMHARRLINTGLVKKPIIIGMPTLNSIPSKIGMSRFKQVAYFQHNIDDEYVAIAALYFLANADNSVWVFPNCRVPLSVQAKAVKAAGYFTSAAVRLSPGGYLIDMLNSQRYVEEAKRLLHEQGNTDFLKNEQFEHHYHTHQEYINEFKKYGLEVL